MSKSKEKKIWLITDTHFGHARIIDLCHRPDDYELKIQEGLSVVGWNDILIHLGDICLGQEYQNNNKVMSALLPLTTKILVRGNHDKKSDTWYMENGWDFVCKSMTLDKYGKRILLSHKPIDGDYDLNIHGHFHRIDSYDGIPKRHAEDRNCADGRQVLISSEYNNYTPVLLRTVVEKGIGGVWWSKKKK